MKQVSLIFLVKNNNGKKEILLAMKKRGFGKGKWNGVGGKFDEKTDVVQRHRMKPAPIVYFRNTFKCYHLLLLTLLIDCNITWLIIQDNKIICKGEIEMSYFGRFRNVLFGHFG